MHKGFRTNKKKTCLPGRRMMMNRWYTEICFFLHRSNRAVLMSQQQLLQTCHFSPQHRHFILSSTYTRLCQPSLIIKVHKCLFWISYLCLIIRDNNKKAIYRFIPPKSAWHWLIQKYKYSVQKIRISKICVFVLFFSRNLSYAHQLCIYSNLSQIQ